jgi:hypothetical protein
LVSTILSSSSFNRLSFICKFKVNQPVAAPNPAQILSLNCFVLRVDGKPNRFTVKIPKTENVSILKDLIKEKQSPRLNHVVASELILSQVSLPLGSDLEESLKNVDLTPLDPFLPLSQVFPRVEEEHLHIIVQAPTNGEPISLSTSQTNLVHPARSTSKEADLREKGDIVVALKTSSFLPITSI